MINIRIANDCVLFEDMKGLGKKLKELRLEKNLSQVELAKNLNFSNRTISDWEADKIEPNLATIIKICKFYKISVDELLEN